MHENACMEAISDTCLSFLSETAFMHEKNGAKWPSCTEESGKSHICSSRCQVALFRQPRSASPGLAAPSASSRVPSASWEEASRLHLGCPIGPLTYPQLPPMRPAFQYSGAGLCRSPRESGSQVSRLAAGQSPGLRMGFSRVARRVAGRRVRRSGGYLEAATPPAPTALPAR